MIATAALLLAMPALKPDIDALTWLAGSWKAEVWGGTWEETWSTPVAGTMTLSARHISEGKVGIIEFGSIEQGDFGPTLHMLHGALAKGAKTPDAFEVAEASPERAVFQREGDDFPTKIVYTRGDGQKMTCVLSGAGQEPVTFAFARVKIAGG